MHGCGKVLKATSLKSIHSHIEQCSKFVSFIQNDSRACQSVESDLSKETEAPGTPDPKLQELKVCYIFWTPADSRKYMADQDKFAEASKNFETANGNLIQCHQEMSLYLQQQSRFTEASRKNLWVYYSRVAHSVRRVVFEQTCDGRIWSVSLKHAMPLKIGCSCFHILNLGRIERRVIRVFSSDHELACIRRLWGW